MEIFKNAIMGFRQIFFILYCVVFIIGCKKESSYEKQLITYPPLPTPQPISNTEIITVGTINGSSIETAKGVYWIDSTLHYLEMPANTKTFAYGVEKWNNKIFVVGSCYNKMSMNSAPCYWIDGKINFLPLPNTAIGGAAYSIVKYNNALYIEGSVEGVSVIWKIDNAGFVQNLTALPLPNDADGPLFGAEVVWHMRVVGNKLIIFGSYYVTLLTAHLPCYWEIDLLDNKTVTVVENTPGLQAWAEHGDASANKLYMIGDVGDIPVTSCIWTKQGRFRTSKTLENRKRFGSCRLDKDDNLHVSIITGGTQGTPLIWKINPQGQVVESAITMPTGYTGWCFDIDIQGDEYVYGVEGFNNSEQPYPFIQKNNTIIPLQVDNNIKNSYINMYSIKIVTK